MIALLSLSSKVAKTLLGAREFALCDQVLGEGAEHAETIRMSTTLTAVAAESLALHCALRMRYSVQAGKPEIAAFVRSQADELVGKFDDRQVSRLVPQDDVDVAS